jgi:hypothetical protein
MMHATDNVKHRKELIAMGSNLGNGHILSVNHPLVRGIGIVGIVVFLAFAGLSFYNHQQTEAACFLILAALSLIPFLVYGTTEMDEQAITSHSIIGNYRIRWNEVKHIELDNSEGGIVFKGDGKQLVIPGRFFWSGEDKKQMVELFDQQVKTRKLEIKESFLAAYAFSKNTRI